jgi:parallel beta-helix repeat protein
MKNKKILDCLKTGISVTIILALMTHTIVVAADTEPPVISSIWFEPEVGLPDDDLFMTCRVTDNIGVSDVRINISGPGGLAINESMSESGGYYDYQLESPPLGPSLSVGIYYFFIWANDTGGNTATSDIYYIVILEDYMEYVHVDASNIEGPWYGTMDYPFQYIRHGIVAVETGGTVFVYHGIYQNILINKRLDLVGKSNVNTVIDGGGSGHVVEVEHYVDNVTISNFMIRNGGQYGIYLKSPNSIVTDCNIYDNNMGGIHCYSSSNIIYHNNFVNNSENAIAGSGSSEWDDGTTGNYWNNYRVRYPDAIVEPETGTWITPYEINSNNIDMHPWVIPDGQIDEEPPIVEVVYPDGEETVASEISITWTAEDDLTPDLNGTILIEYSNDNGNTWYEIATNLDNTGTHLWDTTEVEDGEEYLIRVNATDEFANTGSDVSDEVFTINNLNIQLAINAPSHVTENTSFQVNVTANGMPIENAQVEFIDQTKYTDGSGSVTYKAPIVDQDTEYSIEASYEGYISATQTITVLNQEPDSNKGWIFGLVCDDSRFLLKDASICVIIVEEDTGVTSKCTLTNEDGQYVLSVTAGTYTVEASKNGYETSFRDIIVNKNEAVGVDFSLQKIVDHKPETYADINEQFIEAKINTEIENNKIGGKIDVADEYNIKIYNEKIDINIESITRNKEIISFRVEADEDTPGQIFVVRIQDFSGEISVELDGKQINETVDLELLFAPDNQNAEFVKVFTSNASYVLTRIPSWSEHTITISTVAEAITATIAIAMYIIIGIIAAVLFAGTIKLRKRMG